MTYLVLASLLWALSFGLIKHFLADVDAAVVATIRLFLSYLVFAPFMKKEQNRHLPVGTLMAIGAVQFGVMYVAYIQSYHYLAGHEVAILTVLTPIYVTLIDDALEKRFDGAAAAAAIVAVAGALFIVYRTPDLEAATIGVLLHQVSSVAFAAGQVWYRRVVRRLWRSGIKPVESAMFPWLYLGGFLVALAAMLAMVDTSKIALNKSQAWVLLYLGVLPSGLGFFAWNKGAARVQPGTLAAMNNLKIPLAVAAAVWVFGEKADLFRLLVGGAIIVGAVAWYEAWLKTRPSGASVDS